MAEDQNSVSPFTRLVKTGLKVRSAGHRVGALNAESAAGRRDAHAARVAARARNARVAGTEHRGELEKLEDRVEDVLAAEKERVALVSQTRAATAERKTATEAAEAARQKAAVDAKAAAKAAYKAKKATLKKVDVQASENIHTAKKTGRLERRAARREGREAVRAAARGEAPQKGAEGLGSL